MSILEHLQESQVSVTIEPGDKENIIGQLAQLFKDAGKINDTDPVIRALMDRELVSSTGVGQGVALPHARSTEVRDLMVCCGICPTGADFDALDNEPVHVFFAVLSPQDAPGAHLKLLSSITRVLSDEAVRHQLQNALTPGEVIKIIEKVESART